MTNPVASDSPTISPVILHTILFLFFFQLIADFVEAVYAFGLRGTSMPPEVVCIVLLLSPAALVLLPGLLSVCGLTLVGPLMLLSRVAYPALDTRGKMIVAGIGTACFLICLPVRMVRFDNRKVRFHRWLLGWSLSLAVALSILFRVLGSGVDISTVGWTQGIGWLLAAGAAWAMLSEDTRTKRIPNIDEISRPSFLKIAMLTIGLMGVLVTLYFSITAPNVVARWTGVDYWLIVLVVIASFGLLAWLAERQRMTVSCRPLLIPNIMFVLAMVLTILAHQTSFSPDASGYPLSDTPRFSWHLIPLLAMLILWPVLLLDFALFAQSILAERPSVRQLGAAFLVASLFLVGMIFAQIFTTVYDYIPVVGPFFRDRFWLVFLFAGLSFTLPCLCKYRRPTEWEPTPLRSRLWSGSIILLGMATAAGLAYTRPRPASSTGAATNLKILSYNIQQGYSIDGQKNLDAQLELIRRTDADIIGLQESDTNRISGGNCDVVRYYADRLNTHSYYGAKTVSGTFGIALLSKYPIKNPRTFFMFSEGEQTAAIVAEIAVSDRTFLVYVTHLGNGGPMVQQEAILQDAAGKSNVVLMGDFNFRPDGKQYALTRNTLDDAWLLRWPKDADDEGIHIKNRIDYIFVTPGTKVREARYILSPVSDHPAMMAEIEW